MASSNRIKKYVIFGVLFLLLYGFPKLLSTFEHHFATLPYMGEHQIDSISGDTTFYQIPEFELVNHKGEKLSKDSMLGNIWIASFYDLNSPNRGKITNRLVELRFTLREKLRANEKVRIVSFSTNPKEDAISELEAYVGNNRRYETDPKRWQFATGDSLVMDNLLRNGFMLGDYSDVAHVVWLVDKQGHLRGYYDLKKADEIRRAFEDINLLIKEEDIQLRNE